MKKSKPKLTFLRRGKMVRVYHDGKYSHSIAVADLVKLSNTMKDAVRATGPVSTVVQILQEEDDDTMMTAQV